MLKIASSVSYFTYFLLSFYMFIAFFFFFEPDPRGIFTFIVL